jgi:hypothetical protein
LIGHLVPRINFAFTKLCRALGQISDRLALAQLVCVALAAAFDARAADDDCVRCLRLAVAEPLQHQLNILRAFATEIPRALGAAHRPHGAAPEGDPASDRPAKDMRRRSL